MDADFWASAEFRFTPGALTTVPCKWQRRLAITPSPRAYGGWTTTAKGYLTIGLAVTTSLRSYAGGSQNNNHASHDDK